MNAVAPISALASPLSTSKRPVERSPDVQAPSSSPPLGQGFASEVAERRSRTLTAVIEAAQSLDRDRMNLNGESAYSGAGSLQKSQFSREVQYALNEYLETEQASAPYLDGELVGLSVRV